MRSRREDISTVGTHLSLRWVTMMALSLIAIGIVLRVIAYFWDRSLWHDEIAIALNVRLRSFSGLLDPLDFEQTMPIPLLLAIKFAVLLFGSSEYSLRLPLLLAGSCTLVVIWLAFREIFGVRIALICLLLAAVCRPLIYYSSEVKQYGLDALVTVVTLWAAFKLLDEGDDFRWLLLAGWGILALFLSQPSIFVLAGVWLAGCLDLRFRQSPTWRVRCIVAAVLWAGTFALLYFYSYRVVSQSAYMRNFWATHFLYPVSTTFLHQLGVAFYFLLGVGTLHYARTMLLVPLFAVGIYGIWRSYGLRGVVIAMFPFVALIAAAVLRLYPIAARLVLFVFPILFWIYATALSTLSRQLPRRLRLRVLAVAVVTLLVPTVVKTLSYVVHFPMREANRQLVRLMKDADPTAPTYIAFHQYLEWAYYSGDWNHPETLKTRTKIAFLDPDVGSFTYISGTARKEEIVGKLPAQNQHGSHKSDEQWAREETGRILSLRPHRVWIFLPLYPDRGVPRFKERSVLEKLQAQLTDKGASLLKEYSISESKAFLYALPPPEAPFAGDESSSVTLKK
jgi:hypothetical protein